MKNLVVVEAMEGAGAVVYWSLSGAIDHAKLVAAWKAAGLDPEDLVEPPSAIMALQRAVRAEAGKRVLARSIDRGHWALVEEAVVNDKLVYYDDPPMLDARLDVANDALVLDPPNSEVAAKVRAEFDRGKAVVESRDVSNWLADLCSKLGGVTLRVTGGIYFLPPNGLADFEKAIAVLESVSAHRIENIPAMRSDKAVRAVLHAVEAEAEAAALALEEDLAKVEEFGPKALYGRRDKAEKMKAKLAGYEELLGVGLEALKDKLDVLRANLAAAALAAEAEEDAA